MSEVQQRAEEVARLLPEGSRLSDATIVETRPTSRGCLVTFRQGASPWTHGIALDLTICDTSTSTDRDTPSAGGVIGWRPSRSTFWLTWTPVWWSTPGGHPAKATSFCSTMHLAGRPRPASTTTSGSPVAAATNGLLASGWAAWPHRSSRGTWRSPSTVRRPHPSSRTRRWLWSRGREAIPPMCVSRTPPRLHDDASSTAWMPPCIWPS